MLGVPPERIAGKYGYVFVASNRGLYEKVHFTSWTAKIKRTFDDVTSTVCYHPRNGIVYAAAIPVATSMTVEVAGRFRRCETSKAVVDMMFNSSFQPFIAEIGFSPLDPYMGFHAFIEDLEVTVPIEGIVDFTCMLRSFGAIEDLTMIGCGEIPPVDPDYPGYPNDPPPYPSPGYPSPGTP
jgi:hypothetical protein